MLLQSATLFADNKAVKLVWQDGFSARFHALWLRDNALDNDTRNPTNGQRLLSVLDIPKETGFKNVSISETNDLCMTLVPGNKSIKYSSSWLRDHVYDNNRTAASGWLGPNTTTWAADLQGQVATAQWHDLLNSRSELGRWLNAVRTFGIAVLEGVPTEPGAVCEVVRTFGYVRETNYGRCFDVRSEVNPENLAYTNLGLQAHTDNPYRDPQPTLQLLTCLENSVAGGESLVVDGFRIAQLLHAEDPQGFTLLTSYCADFEFSGSAGVTLKTRQPMIDLAVDGQLRAVRFNNRSTAAFTQIPFAVMDDYYSAYRRFAGLVEDRQHQVSFKLSPGQLFIVDNTRILHARKAFSGSGRRWLQGCYADKDGLLSTLRVIEQDACNGAAR